ncbi:MAG: hypothetical protein A3E88_04950 [Legionellales bacterium RIFCSPHIGHO2_12_FULL_35_11]|nr:MAG: hypothetical protein A3E88_04950 [Legionellales bacterium RIFCSPHIGHO2_12_FULL_35_11]
MLNIKNSLRVIILFCLVVSFTCFSDDISTKNTSFLPTDAKHASWVFLGMVESESGDVYDYFFQVERNDKDFHATVALFDVQTKNIVFQEDSSTKIDEPDNYKWEIGRVFLRFSKITNNWIFGIKNQNKTGFNFKVGMLDSADNHPVTKKLQNGTSFFVSQVGQLNGNIKGDTDEQFVTAKSVWFRQIWFSSNSVDEQINGLLCTFNDGRGMYSMNVMADEELQDSTAGYYDATGLASTISQFIKTDKINNESWMIQVSIPKMNLELSDNFKNNHLIAGFLSNNDQGFCLLNLVG